MYNNSLSSERYYLALGSHTRRTSIMRDFRRFYQRAYHLSISALGVAVCVCVCVESEFGGLEGFNVSIYIFVANKISGVHRAREREKRSSFGTLRDH